MKKQYNFFDIIYLLIGAPWIFLMIMSSGLYTTLKTILLISLFVTAVFEMLITRSNIKKNIVIIVSIFTVYFSLSLCYGILKGYDFSIKNDFQLLQYYIFTPICVVVLAKVFLMKDYRTEFIWKLLKYITLLLVVLNIVVIVFNRVGISLKIFSFIKISSNNMTDNKLALRVTNESSLMFLLPIYIFLLINGTKNKKIYGIIVIFGILYSLISGRKMLEVVEGLSIIVSIIIAIKNIKINSSKILKYMIGVCLLLIVFSKFYSLVSNSLGIENMFEVAKNTIINGFAPTSGGTVKRISNAKALNEMFWKSPFIGNGLNSYDINSLASDTTKWSYEIYFNALLSQTGIIGISIMIIIIWVIIKNLYKNYKKYNNLVCLSIMIGFISFIICSASNPMIYFIWPWTISLIYIFNPSIKE